MKASKRSVVYLALAFLICPDGEHQTDKASFAARSLAPLGSPQLAPLVPRKLPDQDSREDNETFQKTSAERLQKSSQRSSKELPEMPQRTLLERHGEPPQRPPKRPYLGPFKG